MRTEANAIRRVVCWTAVGFLLVASCGNGDTEDASTSTVSPASTTTTTSAVDGTSTTSRVSAPSTTTTSLGSPPVINIAGSTTIYSQNGELLVNGWLNRPAEIIVGESPADVLTGPDGTVSTFEAVLRLEPGSHAVPVLARDEKDLTNEIVLTVHVDPELEVELAFIQEVDLAERTLVADYVEFLTGDEATEAAREDGVIEEDEENPGGFYLRNRNPRLRTLPLGDPEMVVLQACFPEPGLCVVEHAVELDTWAELLTDPATAEEQVGWAWYGGASAPYWLTMQDGVVVQVEEQYLP